jgi:hypothetical protein
MKYKGILWSGYITATLSLVFIVLITWIAYYQLYDISSPDIAISETSGMVGAANLIAEVTIGILLILASICYWKYNKKRLFPFTAVYAIITSFIFYWFTEEQFHFKKEFKLWKGEFSLSYFGAIIATLLYAVLILIIYSIIKYFRNQKIKTA